MATAEKIKVLAIEDDVAYAQLVRDVLGNSRVADFELLGVPTLAEALKMLAAIDFDACLVDLGLPDANGVEALVRLRDASPHTPLVVLTADDKEETALAAMQIGAQDYLVKGEGVVYMLPKTMRYAIERKRSQERLVQLSQYDYLTGLPNRVLFRDRLTRALARVTRSRQLIALMILDLDRFKDINDSLGHGSGDQLLQAVAHRLTECVREVDTVARLGGDEFTVILEGISRQEDAAVVASRMLLSVAEVCQVRGRELYVSTSIGIAVSPPDSTNSETLVKYADAAMYRAKEVGRNNYQFYTQDMNAQSFKRLELHSQLHHALQRDEFILHYQPQIDLHTGLVTGVEGLIRWRHPTLGLVSPADFIPALEQTGLIVPVGEWVVRTACVQTRKWQDMGLPPMRVSVNLSARQFRHLELPKAIARILEEVGLDPGYLDLELTEGLLIEHSLQTQELLAELNALGVHISIDDFGTGYSSLAYLKRFPINTLKIDRSFVSDITISPDDAAIATAIIALGTSLRLTVIAEGVETAEQLRFLRDRGCHQAQGYFIARPMPAEEIPRWLAKNPVIQVANPDTDFASA